MTQFKRTGIREMHTREAEHLRVGSPLSRIFGPRQLLTSAIDQLNTYIDAITTNDSDFRGGNMESLYLFMNLLSCQQGKAETQRFGPLFLSHLSPRHPKSLRCGCQLQVRAIV